jgi:ABC-type sugar transport system ATPase subunit
VGEVGRAALRPPGPRVFADLTVAENVAIGHGFETGPIGNVRWRAVRRRTQVLLERFEIPATPDTPVGLLRPADRTMVAIARALQDQEGMHEGVLVLDEPTHRPARARGRGAARAPAAVRRRGSDDRLRHAPAR